MARYSAAGMVRAVAAVVSVLSENSLVRNPGQSAYEGWLCAATRKHRQCSVFDTERTLSSLLTKV